MNKTKRKILQFLLENNQQNLTAHEIAIALNLSQATVQKYLRDFKQAGRFADFMPGRYRLMNPKIYFDNCLFVYKKNQLAAYLNFENGQYSFTYNSNYLCQPDATPVSPKMEFTEQILYSEKLFNVFTSLVTTCLWRFTVFQNYA